MLRRGPRPYTRLAHEDFVLAHEFDGLLLGEPTDAISGYEKRRAAP
jgi:hypothetical protein